MQKLSEEGRMQFARLFRQITQQNPPLEELFICTFSESNDINENVGEFMLESILNSRIELKTLKITDNYSWF